MLPSDAEVLSQGFKPLKKMTTMPSSNGSKTEAASGGGKRVSFCDIKTGTLLIFVFDRHLVAKCDLVTLSLAC